MPLLPIVAADHEQPNSIRAAIIAHPK